MVVGGKKSNEDMLTFKNRSQYATLNSALLYVPQYMMEHKATFGYKETEFVIYLDGQKACVGTVIKGLVEAEKRSLTA